jgi:hypothetical protein
MNFVNITHNLETFSDNQIKEFKIVEKLLNNLNLIKPSHVNINKLEYSDNSFKVVSFGFAHSFLLNDIEKAILGNLESHKEFIIEKVRENFKDYDYNKTPTNLINTKTFLDSLIKYYSDYPLYNDNNDFKDYIKELNVSIQKALLK